MHCVCVTFEKILQLVIWKKKTRLKGSGISFYFDVDPIDTNNILDIFNYLMKKP